MINPIYTPENTKASNHIKWAVTIFWRKFLFPEEFWLQQFIDYQKQNKLYIEKHRIGTQNDSLFTIGATVSYSPQNIIKRVKGHIQTIIRSKAPQAFKRNFCIRSIGNNKRENIEKYISSQLSHHQMADDRVQNKLEKYQINNNHDISKLRSSSHGLYLNNLHLVLVRAGRWHEIDDEKLTQNRVMILKSAKKKGHLLSKVSIFPDHFHLLLSCNINESPEEIALSYMNNLSYSEGMKEIFQHSYYIETVGEYNKWAVLGK